MSLFATLEANAEKILQHVKRNAAHEMAALGGIDEETKHIIDVLETHILTITPAAPAETVAVPTPTTPIVEPTDTGVIATISNAVTDVVHTIENLV